MISHIAKVLLRLYDGVEVAAISNVDNDLTESFDLCRQPLRVKEARNIGEPHFLDEAAFLSIGDVNLSGWSVDQQFPGSHGVMRPFSMPIVTVPMVPWPH